jgi:hypothetical protein
VCVVGVGDTVINFDIECDSFSLIFKCLDF